MAKRKSSPAAKQPKNKQPTIKKHSRELIFTLNEPDGDVAKIEELASAGKRRAVSESDLAMLAGHDIVEALCEVFEAAYIAGVRDGVDDVLGDDAPAGELHARQVAQESVGKEILRSGIRRVILRQVVRRDVEHARETTPQNGAHDHEAR